MGKFKVKVDTPEESKEVQEILVKMGYHARANWSERNPIHDSIQAWPDGEFTFSLNHDRVPVGFKGITLPELRAMVNPMKEYLVPQNAGGFMYKKAYESKCIPDGWIEIPEGAIRARFYPKDPDVPEFENNFKQWWDDEKQSWVGYGLKGYADSEKYSRVVWQRSETEYLMQGKNGDKLMESIAELKNQETVKVTIDELKNRVDATLAERQSQYGSFKDVADTTAALLDQFALGRMSNVQREALHMICSKLARIANGDPNHVDSWHDIAGYATLVVDDLES